MRATTTLLVAAALSACSSDGTSSTTSTSTATATDLLVSIAQLDCTEAFSCQTSYPGDSFTDDYGASVDQCVQDSTDPTDLATIEGDVADGTIIYDTDQAAACISGISYSDCATYWSDGTALPDACDNAFVGTIADGGTCNVDFDCAGLGSFCDPTFVCTPAAGFAATRRHRIATLLHHL